VRLELVNAPFHGYYHNERYIIVAATIAPLGSVREMPVKSVIAWPVDGEVVASGSHTIFGFAWSGQGQISQVEVSTDGRPHLVGGTAGTRRRSAGMAPLGISLESHDRWSGLDRRARHRHCRQRGSPSPWPGTSSAT